MLEIFDINCGQLGPLPGDPNAGSIVHCLVLKDADRVVLIDSGFGLNEMRNPLETLGKESVEFWGIVADERLTANYELRRLGIDPEQVTDIVITHGDVDHVGGLADFPQARIHISAEEYHQITTGNPRYVQRQFAHGPKVHDHSSSTTEWKGLESREVDLGLSASVFLIPLFGHTLGQCGIAVDQASGSTLHVGDAYYRRVELDSPENPFSAIPPRFAADNDARLKSLEKLRHLKDHHPDVNVLSAHDSNEYKATLTSLASA